MLKTNKSITFTGGSYINDFQVVSLHAVISTKGTGGSVNQSIINNDLYETHKKEIRKDISDFQTAFYEIEDEIAAETVVIAE